MKIGMENGPEWTSTLDEPKQPRPIPLGTPEANTTSLAAPMVDAARAWMLTNFGQAKITQPDWYANRLGILVDFVMDVYGSIQDPDKE